MSTADKCPHCEHPLSMAQIIQLMNGCGVIRSVKVRLPDGRIVVMEARDVNPNTMTVVSKN